MDGRGDEVHDDEGIGMMHHVIFTTRSTHDQFLNAIFIRQGAPTAELVLLNPFWLFCGCLQCPILAQVVDDKSRRGCLRGIVKTVLMQPDAAQW
jgi:hypothetical protein